MRMALHYRFLACECLGTGGMMVEIAHGIWPVAERDPVLALVSGKVISLDSAAFERLKLEGKASLLV